MKLKLLLPLFLLPIALFGQVRIKDASESQKVQSIIPLSINTDGPNYIYQVNYGLGNNGPTRGTTSRTGNSNSKPNSNHQAEYFQGNLTNNRTQRLTIPKGLRFIPSDTRNGMYALQGSSLVRSINGGKKWTTIYDQMDDAIAVCISPDGKKIAFTKEVAVLSTTGKNNTGIRNSRRETRLFIAIWNGRNPILDVMDMAMQDRSLVGSVKPPLKIAEEFAFTPDSESLLYVGKTEADNRNNNADIFKFNIRSRETSNISTGLSGYNGLPQISPDGKKYAWVSSSRSGNQELNKLIVKDMISGKRMDFTAKWNNSLDGDFLWGDRGERIFFTAAQSDGNSDIWYVNVPANLNTLRGTPTIELIFSSRTRPFINLFSEFGKWLIVETTELNNNIPGLYRIDKRGGSQIEKLFY